MKLIRKEEKSKVTLFEIPFGSLCQNGSDIFLKGKLSGAHGHATILIDITTGDVVTNPPPDKSFVFLDKAEVHINQ